MMMMMMVVGGGGGRGGGDRSGNDDDGDDVTNDDDNPISDAADFHHNLYLKLSEAKVVMGIKRSIHPAKTDNYQAIGVY